jgi:hypothetical protein
MTAFSKKQFEFLSMIPNFASLPSEERETSGKGKFFSATSLKQKRNRNMLDAFPARLIV